MRILTLLFVLLFSIPALANQEDVEFGNASDLYKLTKIYVRCEDDDSRALIVKMIQGYDGLEVVSSAKEAEIILEYRTLTRDVAPNYGPYARASMAQKSQMRAYVTKPDGRKVVAWTETESYEVKNGMTFGAPNEMNLTHHFINDIQETKGEKKSSIRALMKSKPKQKEKT